MSYLNQFIATMPVSTIGDTLHFDNINLKV